MTSQTNQFVNKVLSFSTVSKKHCEELNTIISSVSPDPCRKTAVIEQTAGGLGKEQRVCVCVCWGEGEGEEAVAVLPGEREVLQYSNGDLLALRRLVTEPVYT